MAGLIAQLVKETKAQIYARGLTVATALGLNVTSWIAGDPTRATFWFLAEILSILEVHVAGYIASGFLEYAEKGWLTLLAKQLFNVEREPATYAVVPITFVNSGGGYYDFGAGDVRVKNHVTGKTYASTEALLLPGGTTRTIVFEADEEGSASGAGAGDITELVTALLGVTVTNATACAARDEESDPDLRDRCRAKLGTLSPNGPRDAYDFVVRTPELTGVDEITRSRTDADSTTGDVTVYVASTSGGVSAPALAAALAAVKKWATPQCVTPHVVNCSGLVIAVTYEVWLYASVGEDEATIKATISDALDAMLRARPIGGDVIAPATTGKLYQSLIAATIKATYPNHIFRVNVATPGGDTALSLNQVVAAGTHSGTVHLEVDP